MIILVRNFRVCSVRSANGIGKHFKAAGLNYLSICKNERIEIQAKSIVAERVCRRFILSMLESARIAAN